MLELRALIDVAESHRSRRSATVEASCQRSRRRRRGLTELGRDRTATAGTLYNNWALALDRSWPAVSRRRRSTGGPSSLGRVGCDGRRRCRRCCWRTTPGRCASWAASTKAAAHARARPREGPGRRVNEVVINQSLLLRAAIYREQGSADRRAAAMLAEVEPRPREPLCRRVTCGLRVADARSRRCSRRHGAISMQPST